MQKTETYQVHFLERCRSEKTPVTVFLVNGFQMRGCITGHDNFVLLLEVEGKQEMVYKHAISTIIPAHPVPLGAEHAG